MTWRVRKLDNGLPDLARQGGHGDSSPYLIIEEVEPVNALHAEVCRIAIHPSGEPTGEEWITASKIILAGEM